jgi:hypothetical protein
MQILAFGSEISPAAHAVTIPFVQVEPLGHGMHIVLPVVGPDQVPSLHKIGK